MDITLNSDASLMSNIGRTAASDIDIRLVAQPVRPRKFGPFPPEAFEFSRWIGSWTYDMATYMSSCAQHFSVRGLILQDTVRNLSCVRCHGEEYRIIYALLQVLLPLQLGVRSSIPARSTIHYMSSYYQRFGLATSCYLSRYIFFQCTLFVCILHCIQYSL